MVPVPNSTAVTWPEPERSPCMVGIFPVVYYSVLLGLGLPVNILTAVALSRLATRTKKSSYWYLLALTTSDILTQVFIIFVGFILQTAILARAVPRAFVHIVNVLEFTANHASIWVTVLLTVDRYVALCHPLRYRTVSYPRRTRRIIAAVFAVALATGIPFYWWLDAWRDADPPTALDRVLKWVHCVTIYFLPCSIFLAANSVIIHKLKQRGRSGGRRPHRGKTTALLLAVTAVFIVLWAPRTAVMMCHLYVASVKRDWRVHLALDVANMAAMLNTTLNFFLYCFVSDTFRRAVSEVLRAHAWHGPRHGGARLVSPTLSPSQLLGTACSARGCRHAGVSVLTQQPVGPCPRDAAPLRPQSCGAGGGGSSQPLSSSNSAAKPPPGLGPGELRSPGEEAM